ncbi:MAG: DUF2516 family protein [Frankiaceae bacterium]|nr:DUF2516 family protein [Frankiaceae bacterium]MBV9870250.1 DUF2516 family protein [Frankiaceae bacterium]
MLPPIHRVGHAGHTCFDADARRGVPTYALPVTSLLFPLHGALFIISVAVSVLTVLAIIGVLTQPAQGFVLADKQTKLFWIMLLVLGVFISIVGVIASLVYFLDVRPAVEAAGGGGGRRPSSSDGPYGPPPPRR